MNSEVKKLVEQIKFPVRYDNEDFCYYDADGELLPHKDRWFGNLIATALNNLQPKEESGLTKRIEGLISSAQSQLIQAETDGDKAKEEALYGQLTGYRNVLGLIGQPPSPSTEQAAEGLYGFFYNDCIHESAYALKSLHYTKEDAQKAMAKHKAEKYREWQKIWGDEDPEIRIEFGEHQDWFVEQVEVEGQPKGEPQREWIKATESLPLEHGLYKVWIQKGKEAPRFETWERTRIAENPEGVSWLTHPIVKEGEPQEAEALTWWKGLKVADRLKYAKEYGYMDYPQGGAISPAVLTEIFRIEAPHRGIKNKIKPPQN